MAKKNPALAKSELVEELPLACADEAEAVKFFERQRWGDCPCCPRDGCGDTDVYRMTGPTAEKRGLWRCRGCKRQFTVRVSSIYEDSHLPLRYWARTFWECAAAKNGISALELSRKLQISYKSALFLMKRVRFAMANDPGEPTKLTGTLEADESFFGGRVRLPNGVTHSREGIAAATKSAMAKKVAVGAVIQRGGVVRTRILPRVNSDNLMEMIQDNAHPSATLYTDGNLAYRTNRVRMPVAHHNYVSHHAGEYVLKANPTVHSNTVENFFGRCKRSIAGVYHNVSKEHLPRYLAQWEFAHDTRKLNDGERVTALMNRADGKRLTYRDSVA